MIGLYKLVVRVLLRGFHGNSSGTKTEFGTHSGHHTNWLLGCCHGIKGGCYGASGSCYSVAKVYCMR